MLPVLDNLENAAKVETKDEDYKKGIELVLKQFKDVLKSKGVEEKKSAYSVEKTMSLITKIQTN